MLFRSPGSLGTRAASEPGSPWPSCTSVGMSGEEMPIDPAGLRGTVVDLAYSSRGDTALVRAARAHGLRAIDGIDVLVQQAIASLEIWLGRPHLGELAPELRKAALA